MLEASAFLRCVSRLKMAKRRLELLSPRKVDWCF